MSTYRKRSDREAEKRAERVYFKFIVSYVKHVHGDIYEEADKFHKTIREKYPTSVKDLTKTQEFMNIATPSKTVPRYYMQRETKQAGMLDAVLEIPLLPSSPQQPQASPQPSSPQQPQASPQPSSPQQPQASPQPSSLPQPIASPPLSLLPDAVYNQLLLELQQDPDLTDILNNFPNTTMQDDNLHQDIWYDIEPEHITPLEVEIESTISQM